VRGRRGRAATACTSPTRAVTVDAFDISEVAVRKARDFARGTGVKVNFAVADIASCSGRKGLYDGVAAIFIQFATRICARASSRACCAA
jgi:hypothetical protein